MKKSFNPIISFPRLYQIGSKYSALEQEAKTQLMEQRTKRALGRRDSNPWSFKALMPAFFRHQKYNDKAASTVAKYEECLKWIPRYLPYIVLPTDLTLGDVISLKEKMLAKNLSLSRINHVMTALRMFLQYCQEEMGLKTIDYTKLKIAKIPYREGRVMTKEELNRFLSVMDPDKCWGLRMRTICEFMMSTASRPTAAFAVDYSKIEWLEGGTGQVVVVGKRNRENILTISPRAKEWIVRYLQTRKDDNPALFVTFGKTPKRITANDLHKLFKHYSQKAGLDYTANCQILRRTASSIMEDEGADIYQRSEFLNHARIETTIRYYARRKKSVLQATNAKYLKYG